MRKHGTISEVVDAFENGKEGPYDAGNVWFRGNVLYSYGEHFPLVVRLPDDSTIMNADKYSVTTSQHQTACMGWGDVQIPFSALGPALGVASYDVCRALMEVSIIAKSAERWDLVSMRMRDENGFTVEYRKPTAKDIDEFNAGYEPDPESGWEQIGERRPEAIVFEHKGRCFLSSMDENVFFIVELPEAVETVEAAFEILKPEQVKAWEAKGREVKRQGEWFFLEVPGVNGKREYKALAKAFVLPLDGPGSNPHKATRGGFLFDLGFESTVDIPAWDIKTPVVSGQVDHPEHRRCSLSKATNPRIYAAFRNTAIGAWSASGNVD